MGQSQRKVKKDLQQIGFRKQVKCHLLQDSQDKIIQDRDNQMDLHHQIKMVQDHNQILVAQEAKLTYLEISGYGKLRFHTI